MRTAFVTGSARNLGRSIAEHLAAAGHAVAINSRDPDAVNSVVDDVKAQGGKAVACPADVMNPDAISAAIDNAEQELGSGIDIFVHAAGLRAHGPLEKMTDEIWDQVLGVNILGAVYCLRRVVPGMKERNWGRVINLAGVSGERGSPNRAPVVVAKSGLIGLTKAIALETAAHGITVNAISPALVDTARPDVLGDSERVQDHYQRAAASVPVGRHGRVEEVSAACMYLCSEEAAFVTGQVLRVNGGVYL